MNDIICYTSRIPYNTEQIIPFIDILLDDTWANEEIIYPETIYEEIGDLNRHLSQKQNYEFLLRAVSIHPFRAIGRSSGLVNTQQPIQPIASDDHWECFRTDCYVMSKYQQELKDTGYYQLVYEHLTNYAMNLPFPEKGVSLLTNMLSYSAEYYYIDDNTQPILVYIPEDFCAGVPRTFAEQLIQALKQCHQKVISTVISNVNNIDNNIASFLSPYIGKHVKAIIGVHCTFFSLKNEEGYLHDFIIAPKYNFIFDHPAGVRELIVCSPQNYYPLLLDRNYVTFATQYYGKYIRGCYHLPPTSMSIAKFVPTASRIYDISFIGSYSNYRDNIKMLFSLPTIVRHLVARFLFYMKKTPSLPAEKAFMQALTYYNIEMTEQDFEEHLAHFYSFAITISYYYREKVIHTLLKSGINIHLFGDSWNNAPFAKSSNCIIHSSCPASECAEIFQQSKISLNIMSGHKDGFTERIANALFNRSVVLTDTTTYLQENFHSYQDLILFNLSDLETLPTIVKELLSDSERLDKIAFNGYQKAVKQHSMIHRAKQLLDIIETT